MSRNTPSPSSSQASASASCNYSNHHSLLLSTSPEATAERLRQIQQEQAVLQNQLRVQQFAQNYPTQFAFPAVITWTADSPSRRTDPVLVQHRLLEAGMLYDVPVTVGETAAVVNKFIQDLEATGCFRAVRVELGGSPPLTADDENDNTTNESSQQPQRVTVLLDEAKWYNLYLGGGMKQQQSASSSSFLLGSSSDHALAQVEAKVGLRNLAGCLDTTQMHYSLDTHHMATWWCQHDRPLYTVLPFTADAFLQQLQSGSQYWWQSKVVWDTIDSQSTRSYQEYQRLLSLGMYTHRNAATGRMSGVTPTSTPKVVQGGLEWNLLFRDVIPRRHATLPYQYAASSQVVSHAGPSVKHSVLATVFGRLGGSEAVTTLEEDNNEEDYTRPHMDYKVQTEVAFPPGDVGFIKSQAEVGVHIPLYQQVSLHLLGSLGILKSLEFGGLTRPATLSDRFLLGGPLQFRGFSPAGIGPRTPSIIRGGGTANSTSATHPPGDALGGDLLYKLTGILSAPAPVLQSMGVTMFAFGQVGTCAHCINPLLANKSLSIVGWDVLASSRASAGFGLATNLFGPRLELTYAIPFRYGPMDVRRNFQVGMGFSMG